MPTLISTPHKVHVNTFFLCFGGNGYDFEWTFECDKNGIVLSHQLTDMAKQNLVNCLMTLKPYIREYSDSYWESGELICDCKATVYLTNDWQGSQCENCDQLYNSSGQRLLPRSMWEERIDEDY